MSGSIPNSGSVFATTAPVAVSTHTLAEYWAVNGITDVPLTQQWMKASSTQQSADAFLDNLTPAQLQEKSSYGFASGGDQIATFATIKSYVELLGDLQARSDSFSGGTGRLESSEADGQDFERAYVGNLAYKINNNVPGAADEARAYLAGVKNQDTITFSKSAIERSQNLLLSYEGSTPHGNWASPDTSATALAVLTDSLKQAGSEIQLSQSHDNGSGARIDLTA